MRRYEETFDPVVKRIFGPAAAVAGSIGTVRRPGEIRIVVEGAALGVGRTFEAALQAALATAAAVARLGHLADQPRGGAGELATAAREVRLGQVSDQAPGGAGELATAAGEAGEG